MMDKVIYEDCPCVTIVTPSFNQGRFIRETIESVLNQNYPNIEYWIIDGGSTDETIDILKSYGDRINWISEKDEGQADAVNKGILRAKGSILGWLNSDDTYLDGAISHAVNFMKENPEADMVYGEGFFIDTKSNIIDRYNTEKFDRKRLAERCIICQPTAFFTKNIVDKVGLLDKRLDLCMDYELWMKIAGKGDIKYTSKYLATSRMYLENKTNSRKNDVYKEACSIIFKHYGYVTLNWLYGYALRNNNEKRNLTLVLILLRYNMKFNLKNIKTVMDELVGFIINRSKLKSDYNGKYDDDWISQDYVNKFIVDRPCSKIVLSGSHIWPLNEKLEIRIRIDDVVIGNIVLKELGDFSIDVLLKDNINSGKHKLKLEMYPTYCPEDYGICKDKRKLTFKLYNIKLEN
jgi:glycosyltransferase involved in cell wall biosynthesis